MKRKKGLIVEDQIIIAMEIETMVTGFGYMVTAKLNTGQKAIDQVETDPPDFVLMDNRLKGEMSGIEAAQKIQEISDIPIIFVTAHLDQKKLEKAGLKKPFEFVLKPINEKVLKNSLEKVLPA